MKQVLTIALFFLLFGTLHAQNNSLREVVATVRPVYSESTVTFLNSFADRLDKQGADSLAAQLKRYAKGNSFGSGFAFTNATDSQTYILTNRHVVAQAQFVNVEFSLEDQSVKSFTNCKIVSVDFENDLALISLPQGVKLDRALVISNRKAEDGEDVFTAGYPGLADKASWQLGKGIVSNSSVHMDQWIPSKNSIIQHTAQIDPGSSGGPLLRRNSDAPRGFEIIGMNTWKVSDRENTNFSIQASVIQGFIDAYVRGEKKMSKESLHQQAMAFIGFAKDGYKPILPSVSYEYISKISLDKFYELYADATPEIRKVVKNQFEEESPIEAVRVIISSVIADKMSKLNWTFESIENFSTEGPVTVNLKEGDKIVKTTWIPDQGTWRISDMESVRFVDNGKFRIAREYGYPLSVSLVNNMDFAHSGYNYYELLLATTYRTFYTYGVGFSTGSMYKATSDDGDQIVKSAGIVFHGGAQLPVKVGPVYVIPYFRPLVSAEIAGFDGGGLSYGYRMGLEVSYNLPTDNYIMAGLGYRKKSFLMFDNQWDPISSFSLFVSFAF